MVLDLLGTALIDGAGAELKKSSDEKKLEEADGDPEKINQILADIERRKKNGNRLILYLIVILFVYTIIVN
jgi:hypothetical protein